MEMCRACLSTGFNMIPMDEYTLKNFNYITNLKVKLSDHIPLYTCEECHSALIFCKEFKDKCISSDHAFKKILILNNEMELNLNQEDTEYYVVITKESQEDENAGKTTDEYNDSKIEVLDDDDPLALATAETIINHSTEIVTDEEIQNSDVNPDILCGLCSAKFINKDTLIEHLVSHNDDNNCQICLEPCNSKSEMLAHRMQHVPDIQKGCLLCERRFLSSASLQFHYMTAHKLDTGVFEKLKQDYFDKTIEFIVETGSVNENEVSSKDKKTARNRNPHLKKNLNKLKRKKIVVETDKIILTESELKKLLEKPKEGFVPYYCGVCPQELEDKRQLMSHLQHHKTDTHCSICELELTSYPYLLAHRLAHIPYSQNSCLYCPRKFFYEKELKEHYLDKHNLMEKVLPYYCVKCFSTYETVQQLKMHMKNKHGAIKYVCDYCSKGFRRKGALVSHIVSHQDRKLYKCDVCDYRAKLPATIKEHTLRRHTKGRVYCRVCRRAFPNLEILDKHRPCVVDADVCPICGINLKMSSNLSRHMRTHTDVYSYKCGLCPSKYKSKTSFDAHMNRHNGTRKYECEYCPMKFYSQPVLIKHRRVHTGERPYACKLCDKAFTGNNNLKVHMRVHGFELIKKKK